MCCMTPQTRHELQTNLKTWLQDRLDRNTPVDLMAEELAAMMDHAMQQTAKAALA